MVRLWALVLLAACSFEPGVYGLTDAGGDSTGGDGGGSASDMGLPDAPMPPPIVFVQQSVTTNSGTNQGAARQFAMPQTAGNLNIVVISWSDGNDGVAAVGDTNFNTYLSATAQISAQGFSQRIYYSSNIKAGDNIVTVVTSGPVPDPKIRIVEYSGIAPSLPVDVVASSNGNSATSAAGPITTTQGRALLFAANVVATTTTGPGAMFTERQLDAGDLVQDRVVDTIGSYSTDAPLSASGGWIMQLVAFKGAP